MKHALLCLAAAAAPFAASAQNGGFAGDNTVTVITVSEVENLPGDSYVALKGSITGKAGSEKYTFQDNTGTIRVEIDDDDWNGLSVKPGDIVIIEGEVDKSWTKPAEIEVDVIRPAL